MKLLRSLKQHYMDLKLQTKLTLVLLVTVLIPALFTIFFFYNRLFGMIAADTIRDEQEAAANVVPQIDAILADVMKTSSDLTKLSLYQTIFFNPVNEEISVLAAGTEGDSFAAAVDSLLEGSVVQNVRIYLDIPKEDLSGEDSPALKLFGTVRERRSYWRGVFAGTDARSLFCPPFYLGAQEQKTLGDEAYIRSTTIYYKGQAVPAFIACYYSSDVFRRILTENLTQTEGVSYIINERDSIVASSNEALTGIYRLSYSNIEDSYMSSKSFVPRTILEKDVYAGFYSINEPRWFLTTVLPQDPMIRQAYRQILKLALIYLAFLLLAFVIATVLSRSITSRISSVSERMNAVREGPPSPIREPSAKDEIGDLINTYNYMTERMNQLLDKQAQAAEDLRIAEFNSLQAQINPHFLYNTMDMINWMAVQGRTGEISNAVQKLSRFYRLTLSRKSTMATIAEEAEHVEIYVELQNMRYHDNISFILDIPDELNEHPIPRLTLQPVIENAIQHGILEKESRKGTIVLTGWEDEGDIVLLVSDDGVGIPEDILKTILTGSGKSASGGTNIAVYNTHRRLQLLYGPKYGLHYESRPGQGTEVEIRIPGA